MSCYNSPLVATHLGAFLRSAGVRSAVAAPSPITFGIFQCLATSVSLFGVRISSFEFCLSFCHLFRLSRYLCGDMMTTQTMAPAANNDAQLVEWSLTGDRDAFRQIVERYKSLVCSITYNATGSLTLSEDLA